MGPSQPRTWILPRGFPSPHQVRGSDLGAWRPALFLGSRPCRVLGWPRLCAQNPQRGSGEPGTVASQGSGPGPERGLGCRRRAGGARGPGHGGYYGARTAEPCFCKPAETVAFPPPSAQGHGADSQAGPWLRGLRSSQGLSGRLQPPELPVPGPSQGVVRLPTFITRGLRVTPVSCLRPPKLHHGPSHPSSSVSPFLLVALTPRHLGVPPIPRLLAQHRGPAGRFLRGRVPPGRAMGLHTGLREMWDLPKGLGQPGLRS